MATWHSHGETLDLSVNILSRQLEHDNELADDIRDALHTSGLPASALIIEVAETTLMLDDIGTTTQRLQAIKELGVRIAVDDFGAAYTSLDHLRLLPVDSLKIDRSFIGAITISTESVALVNAWVQLAQDLGLSITAEGVETTTELDILRGAHVDQAQGYLMAHPLDPETLERDLLTPAHTTPAPLR